MTLLLSETIEQFCLVTPRTKGYSPDTIAIHRHWLRNFLAWAGPDAALVRFDEQGLRDYRAHKLATKNYADRTLASMKAAFRAFAAWLLEEGRIEKDPTHVLGKIRKMQEPKRNLITDVEAFALLDACRRYANPFDEVRSRAMLAVLIHSGIRRGEFLGLHVSDVLLAEGKIHIRRGKGGRKRDVWVCAEAIDALRVYIEQHPGKREDKRPPSRRKAEEPISSDPMLWMYNRTRPISVGFLMKTLHETWAMADLDRTRKFTPHSFRHAFITRLVVHQQADVKSVADLVGHKNTATTLDIYSHSDMVRLKEVANLSQRPAPVSPVESPALVTSAKESVPVARTRRVDRNSKAWKRMSR